MLGMLNRSVESRHPLQFAFGPVCLTPPSASRTAPFNMQTFSWLAALAIPIVLGLGLAAWFFRSRQPEKRPELPTEWALTARPVFSTEERRAYRLLREALPHHIVLSKLPLVRFCQPNDPAEVRYWFDLLGSSHVAFAICSANGRVLAAIDLDTDRASSRRLMQIKQSVLGACRVRYLHCSVENLPSVAELQLLVPTSGAPARAPQPMSGAASNLHQARDSLASTVATRRAERTSLWQDSTLFQDSFFAPDSQRDVPSSSEFSPLSGPELPASTPAARSSAGRGNPATRRDLDDDTIGGTVVDVLRFSATSRH
jgi:Protein of unknown function (DUF2726)